MIYLFYDLEKIIFKIKYRKIRSFFWLVLKILVNLSSRFCLLFYPVRHLAETQKIVNGDVIISLTTFPERFPFIHLVLESIYKQTMMPNRVILWLARDQFTDVEFVNKALYKYINFGLQVRYCDDLKAHKKYFYTMLEFPDSYVVTVDDDILYPEDMLERLLITYKSNPGCIVTHRGHEMTFDKDGSLLPYKKWNWLARDVVGPSIYIFATGGAGCLFFPGCVSDHLFDKEVILSKCLFADDVWLKCMSFMQGTKVVLTGINNPEILDLFGNKENGLAQKNVIQDMNDKQLKAVSEYYHIDWGAYHESIK